MYKRNYNSGKIKKLQIFLMYAQLIFLCKFLIHNCLTLLKVPFNIVLKMKKSIKLLKRIQIDYIIITIFLFFANTNGSIAVIGAFIFKLNYFMP